MYNSRKTDIKESVIFDKEFQSFIDKYDKLIELEKEESDREKKDEGTMGNIPGRAIGGSAVVTPTASVAAGTPMVMQLKKSPAAGVQRVQQATQVQPQQPIQPQQPGNSAPPNVINALRQMKTKLASGVDVSKDFEALLQIIQ